MFRQICAVCVPVVLQWSSPVKSSIQIQTRACCAWLECRIPPPGAPSVLLLRALPKYLTHVRRVLNVCTPVRVQLHYKNMTQSQIKLLVLGSYM